MIKIRFDIYDFPNSYSFINIPFDINHILNLRILSDLLYRHYFFFDTSKSLYHLEDRYLKLIDFYGNDWQLSSSMKCRYFYEYDGSEEISFHSKIKELSIDSSNFLLKWKLKHAQH